MNLNRTLIVSHDAGGAFLLSKWCQEFDAKNQFVYQLRGPAVKIFKEVLPHISIFDDMNISSVDRVITSTGWQTNFEYDAIKEAIKKHIYVVSYLDHWVNYTDRFIRNGERCFPNEIWVGDPYAKKTAVKNFNHIGVKIRLIRNRHLSNLKKKVSKITTKNNSILICLEPIRDGASIDSLYDLLISHLILNYADNERIILRDHPSGINSNAAELLAQLKGRFNVSMSRNSLEDDLASAMAVYGYQSSVLAYAACLSIPTFSFFSRDDAKSVLPHNNIMYIRKKSD